MQIIYNKFKNSTLRKKGAETKSKQQTCYRENNPQKKMPGRRARKQRKVITETTEDDDHPNGGKEEEPRMEIDENKITQNHRMETEGDNTNQVSPMKVITVTTTVETDANEGK